MLGKRKYTRICATLGALAVSTAVARDAEACSYPPPGWGTGLYTREVPTDGVVLVVQSCSYGCDTPPELSVVVREFATGNEVAGEISLLEDVAGRVFAWRASNELAVGEYSVELMGNPQNLLVVAPVDVGFDAVTVTPEIQEILLAEGEVTQCPSGPLDSCGGKWGFYTHLRRSLDVWVAWDGTAAPAHFNQYLYRVTFDGEEPEPWNISSSGGSASASFSEPRAEYCYAVEVKRLGDGTVTTVDEGCVAHPPNVVLESFDREPADIANDLGRCDEPPAGLEPAWCDARAAYCEDYGLPQCESLDTLCADVGDDGDESRTVESRGCSLAPARDRSGAGALVVALFAAFAAVLRRSRSGAEASSGVGAGSLSPRI